MCTETGLQMPVCETARLIARCKRSSNKWCRRSTPLRGSMDSVGEGNTQNHPHDRPTCGYFISKAYGVSTPPRWALRSTSHCCLAARTWARNAGANDRGNMTTRSLLPLASRTMMIWRSKSMSLTRRRKPSISRMPVPYRSWANNAVGPSKKLNTAATSSLVSTLGMRRF